MPQQAHAEVEASRRRLLADADDGQINPALLHTRDFVEDQFLRDVALWRASLHPLQQDKMHALAEEVRVAHVEHVRHQRQSASNAKFQLAVLNQSPAQAVNVGATALADIVDNFTWYADTYEDFKGSLTIFKEFYNGWHHAHAGLVALFLQHDRTLQPHPPPSMTPVLQDAFAGDRDVLAITSLKEQVLQWTTTLGVLYARVAGTGDLHILRALVRLIQKGKDELIAQYSRRAFLLGEGHPPDIQEPRDQKATWLAVKGLHTLLAEAAAVEAQWADSESSSSSSPTPVRRRRRHGGVRRTVVKRRRRR